MLHNNTSSNSSLTTRIFYYLSRFLWVRGLRAARWVVLARGLLKAAVRDQLGLQTSEVLTVAGGPTSKGAHSRGWQSQCWLLAGRYSSFQCGLLYGEAYVASRHGNWLPLKKVIRETEEAAMPYMTELWRSRIITSFMFYWSHGASLVRCAK